MAQEPLNLDGQNPTIHYDGQAFFGKNCFCRWETRDGSTSFCSITNPGEANTLTFVVSGAPPMIHTSDGKPFNGQHSIPPNNPTHNVTAVGDFRGTQVTIFNMSALDEPCEVDVRVAPRER